MIVIKIDTMVKESMMYEIRSVQFEFWDWNDLGDAKFTIKGFET